MENNKRNLNNIIGDILEEKYIDLEIKLHGQKVIEVFNQNELIIELNKIESEIKEASKNNDFKKVSSLNDKYYELKQQLNKISSIEDKKEIITNTINILRNELFFLVNLKTITDFEKSLIKNIKNRMLNLDFEKSELNKQLLNIEIDEQQKIIAEYENKLEKIQEEIDNSNYGSDNLKTLYKTIEKKLNKAYSKKCFLTTKRDYKLFIVKSRDCWDSTSYSGYKEGFQYTECYDTITELKEDYKEFSQAKLISL